MLKSDRIRDYMATELVTVTPDTEILRAARLLVDNNIGGAPVLDAGGRLAGILTEKDLMRVVLNASYYADYGGRVADYMTTAVETIGPDESVVEVAKRFLDQPLSPLPGGRERPARRPDQPARPAPRAQRSLVRAGPS